MIIFQLQFQLRNKEQVFVNVAELTPLNTIWYHFYFIFIISFLKNVICVSTVIEIFLQNSMYHINLLSENYNDLYTFLAYSIYTFDIIFKRTCLISIYSVLDKKKA